MQSGESHFLYSGNVTTCKWSDNKSVIMMSTSLDGLDTLQRRQKGFATKFTFNCPSVVKLYNSGMGGGVRPIWSTSGSG